MKVRMGERLLRRESTCRAGCARSPFPPLMLISLVENAVKHGVEPKTGPTTCHAGRDASAGRGGAAAPSRLVEDDGAGLEPGMGEGTGLANIRAQLRTRFGGRRPPLRLRSAATAECLHVIIVPLELGRQA